MNTPRLIIELKSEADIKLRDKARSLTIGTDDTLRSIVIKALEAYCGKK